jgi:enterochelin esterase-like enzyme
MPGIRFCFLVMAGVDDFNFGELLNLDNKLNELKAPHRFEAVAGGHEWTPKEAITEAVALANVSWQ